MPRQRPCHDRTHHLGVWFAALFHIRNVLCARTTRSLVSDSFCRIILRLCRHSNKQKKQQEKIHQQAPSRQALRRVKEYNRPLADGWKAAQPRKKIRAAKMELPGSRSFDQDQTENLASGQIVERLETVGSFPRNIHYHLRSPLTMKAGPKGRGRKPCPRSTFGGMPDNNTVYVLSQPGFESRDLPCLSHRRRLVSIEFWRSSNQGNPWRRPRQSPKANRDASV